MLSPESALQYWRFDLDHLSGCQLLFDFAERYVRAGNVVWDIGANCGVFSVAASGLAGREGLVVALEPDRFLSGLLFRSASARSAEAAPDRSALLRRLGSHGDSRAEHRKARSFDQLPEHRGWSVRLRGCA